MAVSDHGSIASNPSDPCAHSPVRPRDHPPAEPCERAIPRADRLRRRPCSFAGRKHRLRDTAGEHAWAQRQGRAATAFPWRALRAFAVDRPVCHAALATVFAGTCSRLRRAKARIDFSGRNRLPGARVRQLALGEQAGPASAGLTKWPGRKCVPRIRRTLRQGEVPIAFRSRAWR